MRYLWYINAVLKKNFNTIAWNLCTIFFLSLNQLQHWIIAVQHKESKDEKKSMNLTFQTKFDFLGLNFPLLWKLQKYLVRTQVYENKNTPSDLISTKCVRQKGTAHPQSNLPWECTTHNSSPLPTRQLGLFVVCALQKEMPVSYTNFCFCKNQTNGPSKNRYWSIAWNNDSLSTKNEVFKL